MKRINLVFIVFILTILSCSRAPNIVQWISTTENSPWSEIKYTEPENDPDESIDLELLPSQKQQKIDGFGACFNELGWDALNFLQESEREQILYNLFHPDSGLKFNICRMPIGANDYARSWYSLNDSVGDLEMIHFSVDRDETTLIPYIKSALKYRPDLKIWGSPWCPPAWMKHNGHYACRSDVVNDLPPEGQGREGSTQFIMEPAILKAYADYFIKYLEAYKKNNIEIYAVHVQNEPNSCQNFPSCIWTSGDLNIFIGKYLGPGFEEEGLQTEIWYGTIERPFIENIDTVLQDPVSSKYVDGVGFQWGGKEAIPLVHKEYPGMPLMQTESECGDGSNDWTAAEYTFSLMKHYLNNGANSYLYWNMILDETGKSHWGWKQNSLISVDSETKKITYNPEYYVMKHLSFFVATGAHKIKTDGDYKDVLAFQNPDGRIILFIVNNEDLSLQMQLLIENNRIPVTIPPKSFNTVVVQ